MCKIMQQLYKTDENWIRGIIIDSVKKNMTDKNLDKILEFRFLTERQGFFLSAYIHLANPNTRAWVCIILKLWTSKLSASSPGNEGA